MTKRSSAVLFALMAFFPTVATHTASVAAGEPEPQLRAFILLLDIDATVEDFPDFEGDASRLLVAHAGQPAEHGSVGFFTGDDESAPYVEEFFGTTWISNGYATHVSTNGTRTFRFFWQDELPPNGAFAPIGPDGTLLIEFYWLRRAGPGEGDTTNGHWVAEDDPSSGGRLFCYGVGLFSR